MIEDVYIVGDDVLAHQKQDERHRLVQATYPPPQLVGEWVEMSEVAELNGHQAHYTHGVPNGQFLGHYDPEQF